MKSEKLKNLGNTSVTVIIVGTLIGLGLLGFGILDNKGLISQDKTGLLAQLTGSEIQTKIAELLKLIADLEAQKAATSNTTPASDLSVKITSLQSEITSLQSQLMMTISIKVLSPNGGETFVQGQNNVIQWSGITGTQSDIILTDVDGKRIGYVYSHLFMKGSSRQDLIYWDGNYVSSDGQFIGGANTAVKPGKYKIMVSSINGKVFDFSDAPFTIAAPTTATPSIKLLSPNGGEKLTTGQNYTITWSGVGSPEQVRILLYKGNALNIYETSTFGNIYGSIYFPPNSSSLALNITTGSDIGHYTWSIPANLATGDDYRIRIDLCEATGYCAISDQSDAPFIISVATTPKPTTLSCDITAKAILNAVGSCSKLDSNKYPNVYKACCSVVTRETLLEILEKALQDGRIDENEKMDLLGALDRYLSARG